MTTGRNHSECAGWAERAAVRAGPAVLLRVILGEADTYQHKALHSEILDRARKAGLAGCTVIRGIAGFGANSVVHEQSLLKLSSDAPIVIEIVDLKAHIERFLAEIEPLLQGALVTEEDVKVHVYRHGKVFAPLPASGYIARGRCGK